MAHRCPREPGSCKWIATSRQRLICRVPFAAPSCTCPQSLHSQLECDLMHQTAAGSVDGYVIGSGHCSGIMLHYGSRAAATSSTAHHSYCKHANAQESLPMAAPPAGRTAKQKKPRKTQAAHRPSVEKAQIA